MAQIHRNDLGSAPYGYAGEMPAVATERPPSVLGDHVTQMAHLAERIESLHRRLDKLANRVMGAIPKPCQDAINGKLEREPSLAEALGASANRIMRAIDTCYEELQRLESL